MRSHAKRSTVDDLVPVERNRAVDLVRVLALCGVVFGHWLKQGWYADDAGLHRAGLLGIAPWTHPLTWVFQVIPLFFLVGGFANAVSWRHAQAVGSTYGTWLAGRTRRMARPLLPLLVFWAVAVPVAPRVGLGDDWLRIGSKTSLVPTWFLATYVVVVALVPLTMAAWERWGARTLAVGLLALPVDALSLQLDSTAVGAVNLLLVWGTMHQLGYAWRDGTFRRPSRALLLGLVGLGGALALVWIGPYGVSMVGVDGYGVNNTYPPRATLLLLGAGAVGLVLLAEPALDRFAHRPRVWQATSVIEARMMTIYLWHATALVILGAASLRLGGVGLHDFPNTAGWWASRPVWLVLLGATTAALVAVLGRFESAPETPVAPGRGPGLPVLEVVLIAGFLALLADDGLSESARVPHPWLVVVAAVVSLTTLTHLLSRHSGRVTRPN